VLQVVVFETLVTAILSEIPADQELISMVRETVQDHAKDEGRHHAYFSTIFREMWSSFDTGLRREVARCLPRLITRSLSPNLPPIRANLRIAGLSPADVEQVLADVYSGDMVRETNRQQARQSVRLFATAGVLDLPEGLDAFTTEGLTP
jgi:hypothetical protein